MFLRFGKTLKTNSALRTDKKFEKLAQKKSKNNSKKNEQKTLGGAFLPKELGVAAQQCSRRFPGSIAHFG